MSAQLLWAPRAWVDGGWRLDVLLQSMPPAAGRRSARTRRRRPMRSTCRAARAARPGRRPQPRLPARLRRPGRAPRGRARRLLELARPHVRRGAAHRRPRSCAPWPHSCTPSCCRRLHPGLRVPLPAPRARRQPLPDPLAMSRALADAAADTGIGLTLLPVLYERAGFDQPRLRDDQRRFATTANDVLAMHAPSADGSCRVSMPAWRSTRCARPPRHRSRSWSAHGKPRWARCTSTWPSRPARSTTASQPPASDRSTGCTAMWRSTHAGTWCTPRTHSRRRSPPWRAAVPAWCCARAPRPTSATVSPTCRLAGAGVPMSVGSDSHVCRTWPRSCAGSSTASA
jgi:hypothetical protein